MNPLTQGCTLISWLASLLGIDLPEEGCCNEHDLFYEQGGSIRTKFFADWLLAVCVFRINGGGAAGLGKASLGWIVVTVNPYAWITWFRGGPR